MRCACGLLIVAGKFRLAAVRKVLEVIVCLAALWLVGVGLFLAVGGEDPDAMLYMTLPEALDRLARIGGVIVAGLGVVAVAVLLSKERE